MKLKKEHYPIIYDGIDFDNVMGNLWATRDLLPNQVFSSPVNKWEIKESALPTHCRWRTKTANQRGGSEWEPIKILLEGDRGSNKMITTSNTRVRLNYPSWSRPRSHWSATDPRRQQTTFRAKTHQHAQRKTCTACCLCYTGQTDCLHQLDRWHRSDRWTEPVRPMATTAAQQMFQRASVTSLGSGTKTPPKHNLQGRRTLHKTEQNTSKLDKN
jgi:hypothetical protein